MSVLDFNPFTQYTGTGSRTFFEFGFEVFDGETDVFVTVDNQKVAYTVQATGVVITPAPALGSIVIIYRITDVDQLLDFQAFESFDAAKTEWACDKLIYLKQEALVFRALCNLFGVPYLAYYDIENDKGDDARILIWNEDELGVNACGVFAGEVTQDMPNAGATVAKPDHFAYFQWGEEAVEEVTFTSTPYPIEVFEAVESGMTLLEGVMRDIPVDSQDTSYAIVSGELKPVVLPPTGPYEDSQDTSYSIISGELKAILLPPTGPYANSQDTTYSIVSGELKNELVWADTPDEAVEFGISLIDGSMTDV